MRTLADYLAGSYAWVALLEGNERYERIFRRKQLVTTAMNVLEVYSTLLRRIPRSEAKEMAAALLAYVTPVPPETALAAGEFRQFMRNRRLDCSYIDAWGYASARALGRKFLTGDPAFRSIEDVEYVR